MTSLIQQQPSSVLSLFEQNSTQMEQMTKATKITEQPISTRDNFPIGLRGGGFIYNCFASEMLLIWQLLEAVHMLCQE
ncbi:unnamed protein product [Rotaria magnacalcarata]